MSVAQTFGPAVAEWEGNTHSLHKKEKKSINVEKKLDRDLNDLIEYTKWISSECEKLRDRVKASEKEISDLKTSGEASVESLMETLYILKIR